MSEQIKPLSDDELGNIMLVLAGFASGRPMDFVSLEYAERLIATILRLQSERDGWRALCTQREHECGPAVLIEPVAPWPAPPKEDNG